MLAGYVVAIITYRSRDHDPQSTVSLEDCLAAVDHLRRLPCVDNRLTGYLLHWPRSPRSRGRWFGYQRSTRSPSISTMMTLAMGVRSGRVVWSVMMPSAPVVMGMGRFSGSISR